MTIQEAADAYAASIAEYNRTEAEYDAAHRVIVERRSAHYSAQETMDAAKENLLRVDSGTEPEQAHENAA